MAQWASRLHTKTECVNAVLADGGGVSFGGPIPEWLRERFGTFAYLVLRDVDAVFFIKPTVKNSTLPMLQRLGINELSFTRGANVTDAHLIQLKGLSTLKRLTLQNQAISDEGLRSLTTLSELRELDLWGTSITDVGVAHLAALPELQCLILNSTLVSDAALTHLKEMKLTHLELANTSITDDAIPYLKTMTSLRHLNLKGISVSNEAVAELRNALPEAEIIDTKGRVPPSGRKSSEGDSWGAF